MLVAGLTICLLVSLPAFGQVRGSSLRGTTTTNGGDVRLPGVAVTIVQSESGAAAAELISDEHGSFEVADLPAGRYEVHASMAGFTTAILRDLGLAAEQALVVTIDLTVASVREAVDVVAEPRDAAENATSTHRLAATLIDVAPLRGDDFQALLPVLPGVIRGDDGRLSLKGGRPDQSGLQVSDVNVTDPVTGGYGLELPADAVEAVEVMASPYLAEYGRFASGVARIETRRSDNDWHYTINNFVPIPRIRDGAFRGIASFGPRLLVGGALLRSRLFLTQSLQYESKKTRVPSLPDGENDRELRRFNSFTRLDAHLGTAHHLVATGAVFPREQRYLTLDTFNPETVSPTLRERGLQMDVAENAVLGKAALLESRLSYRRYDVDVLPGESGGMTVTPEGNRGRYFSEQQRRSHSLQWIQALTRSLPGPAGEHRIKVGLDLIYSRYSGWTDNRPVDIERVDGTVEERVRFPGASTQRASSTDLAIFAQDRWRPNGRLLIEAGMRFDRDGVLKTGNLSPRVGASVGLRADGRGILRGGAGLFYQRTPLNVATFESLEPRVVSRVAGHGAAPPQEVWAHHADVDRTPRSFVWSLDYNQELARSWLLKVAHLRRSGRHEFVVEPLVRNGRPQLELRSAGRSRYRESELTVGYVRRPALDVSISYVHSRSEGDFNNYDRYFGNLPTPVIRANEYSRSSVDVPHRVILRGIVPVLRGSWQIAPLLEIRSGFPYSRVNGRQDYIGRRNEGGRFPTLTTLDLAVNRELSVKGRRIRVGLRAHHLLNQFMPRDVQNNIDSPAFGTFYNGLQRMWGVTFQILP